MSLICIRSFSAGQATNIATARPSKVMDNQRRQAAQRQHAGAIDQKAFAGAELVGDRTMTGGIRSS
jgi:hypothetical protein